MDKKIEIIGFEDSHDLKNSYVINTYGEDLTAKEYITNPAIAREKEIKSSLIILLTPEKSTLLIGKAGIGKTAIVEGIAYLIKRGEVPDVLKDYKIIKINSFVLTGKTNINGNEELLINKLVNEVKNMHKIILFIDEIHTLMGTQDGNPLDLANILKPVLDRGDVKVIGATTTEEYNTYVIKDRAFLRRFDKVEVEEPSEEITVKILMGSLPKIEYQTGIKFKYNNYVTEQLIKSIVSATSEFKRVYGLAAMYPDVAFSILTQAFSNALYENKKEVDIMDVYLAIKNSKRIYPDSIIKELDLFRQTHAALCEEENINLPIVQINEIKTLEEKF